MRLCLLPSLSLSFCSSLSLSVFLYHIGSLWLCGSCLSPAVHEAKKEVKCTGEIKLSLPCLFLKLQKCFVRQCIKQYGSDRTIVRGHFAHNHMSFLLCLFYFYYCSLPHWHNRCKTAIKWGIFFYPHVGCSVAQLGIAHKQIVIWTASYNHQHCTRMSKGIGRDFQKGTPSI